MANKKEKKEPRGFLMTIWQRLMSIGFGIKLLRFSPPRLLEISKLKLLRDPRSETRGTRKTKLASSISLDKHTVCS